MFAVIKTGGKQYKVSAGDLLKIEKVVGEAGSPVEFSDVFMIGEGSSTKIGSPTLENALVKATLVEQTRNKKIIVFKKKRRQGYDRKNGHRQHVTLVHIDEIIEGGKTLAKVEFQAKKPGAVEKKEAKVAKKEAAQPKVAAPAKKPSAKASPKAESPVKATEKEAPKKAAAPKKETKEAAPKAISKKAPAKGTAKKS